MKQEWQSVDVEQCLNVESTEQKTKVNDIQWGALKPNLSIKAYKENKKQNYKRRETYMEEIISQGRWSSNQI